MDKKAKQEIKFLDGPQSRWKNFLFTISTVTELIKGFRGLHFVGPCITVFGSARFTEDHEYYKKTQEAAGEFAKLGFTIITGGGPGLMEAANRGAREVGGKSVGCNIILPHEQKHNPYLDKWVEMKHFFTRKLLLVKYSYAFIVMPGGFGTLDEFYEALTLIQTKKIKNFPVIIFCKDFHEHLIAHTIKLKEAQTISEEDLDLLLFTDSIEEAVELIKEKCIKAYNLKPADKIKPLRWLFEKA
jgi:uncharacterized protein (TIGR00730 family)